MQSNSFAIRLLRFLKKKRIGFIYIPMAVYWSVISIVLAIPAEKLYKYSINDKLEHLISHFVLSIFIIFFNSFQEKSTVLRKHPFLLALLFIAVYGMASEFVQLIIPGRFCDFNDWLADMTGGFLGITLIYLLFGKALKAFNEEKIISKA